MATQQLIDLGDSLVSYLSVIRPITQNLSDHYHHGMTNFSNVMRGRDVAASVAIIDHYEGKLLGAIAAYQIAYDLKVLAVSMLDVVDNGISLVSNWPLSDAFGGQSHSAATLEWLLPITQSLAASIYANPMPDVLVIDAAKHYRLDYDPGDTIIFDVPGVRSVHDLASHLSAVDEQAGAVTLHFGETASIHLVGISQVADLHHGDLVFTG